MTCLKWHFLSCSHSPRELPAILWCSPPDTIKPQPSFPLPQPPPCSMACVHPAARYTEEGGEACPMELSQRPCKRVFLWSGLGCLCAIPTAPWFARRVSRGSIGPLLSPTLTTPRKTDHYQTCEENTLFHTVWDITLRLRHGLRIM